MPNAKPTKTGKLEQQILELTEALKRERADATNIRRRHDEEMISLRTRAKSQVISDLLPQQTQDGGVPSYR